MLGSAIAIVHGKRPLLLARVAASFAFSQPVHIVASLETKKVQNVRAYPGRNAQRLIGFDAEIGASRHFYVVAVAVEIEIKRTARTHALPRAKVYQNLPIEWANHSHVGAV